ncbi:MAG TPA: nickel-binding protein [Noviherbaspirillum sp.]|uniref:nickel-binding protein n=1 Tax=Noviherbaspirillum sp. TaxID=1926288 RepID=UPI002D6A4287|nr:nickel-binding protein [Noviherbaspirillum sp.]HYD94126.1 nickel-binding protein [Noviherbaspirillum sp.]
MTTYAVQRSLPGITMEQLAAAQAAAIEASKEASEQGSPVTYIRSNFYPADQRCTCLFEADSKESVEKVNRAASIPFDRVEEVLDIPPMQH